MDHDIIVITIHNDFRKRWNQSPGSEPVLIGGVLYFGLRRPLGLYTTPVNQLLTNQRVARYCYPRSLWQVKRQWPSG